MIQVEAALDHLFVLARPLPTERVPLRQAAGRVLAEPAVARRDQPPFPASAMDGYAIRPEDHVPGRVLTVIAEAAAGHGYNGTVPAGSAVRIFTGAPVPKGAGRVVIQEDVTSDGDRITLGDRMDEASHVRAAAQDFSAGSQLRAPRRLSPADLALLAAMNVPDLYVARRPVVVLIATGDELVMPGEDPAPDQIIASNTFALAAMVEAAGGEARMLPIARDTPESLAATLALAEDADLIVTIGGASVGDHDLVARVAAGEGMERAFYKVAMRPGKPLMAGRLGDAVLLGLPGNPVSAIVCGKLFLVPMLEAMQGLPAEPARRFPAVLAEDVGPNGPREHYMRARLEPGDGPPRIRPFARQDSALLSVLAEADALLIRPVGDGPLQAGRTVSYIPLP